jgi:hypothetical protein
MAATSLVRILFLTRRVRVAGTSGTGRFRQMMRYSHIGGNHPAIAI